MAHPAHPDRHIRTGVEFAGHQVAAHQHIRTGVEFAGHQVEP